MKKVLAPSIVEKDYWVMHALWGFDKTTPYEEKDISSWAYDKAIQSGTKVFDNRAIKVKCYCPE